MLKSGIIAANRIDVNTKLIYESERFEVIADKIMTAFDVGDLIKLFSVEKVMFDTGREIWPLPTDIECAIVGMGSGKFVICYPKGHLVLKRISECDRGTKEFKWRIGIDNNKHYYEIWRSK